MIRTRLKLWVLPGTTLMAVALVADPAPAVAQARGCPPDATQLELNDCAAAAFQEADDELNAVWRSAKAAMDGYGAGALLLDAQRKWIAFRDAACRAEIEVYAGGSIQPLVWSNCLTRLTRQRSFDLRQVLPN